jgi:methylglyoxal synthase
MTTHQEVLNKCAIYAVGGTNEAIKNHTPDSAIFAIFGLDEYSAKMLQNIMEAIGDGRIDLTKYIDSEG